MNDLRWPLGLFFVALGIILLVVAGVEPGARAPLTRANINLYTGLVMFVFGATLLWLARRAS